MYLIDKKIHRTRRSSVYTARNADTQERVVLKKLKTPGATVEGANEARIMEQLCHPNVLQLRGAIDSTQIVSLFPKPRIRWYLVMEACKWSLTDAMHTLDTQSARDSVFMQIISGIEYIHSQGIIHRDIKPSNILLTEKGVVKICDFDISRYHTPDTPMTKLPGTLPYMAIELLLGETQYTPAIDLWSLGCLFYEITARQVLFEGTGEIDQIARITTTLGVSEEERSVLSAYPYGYLIRQTAPSVPLLSLAPSDILVIRSLLAYAPHQRTLAVAKQVLSSHPLPK